MLPGCTGTSSVDFRGQNSYFWIAVIMALLSVGVIIGTLQRYKAYKIQEREADLVWAELASDDIEINWSFMALLFGVLMVSSFSFID